MASRLDSLSLTLEELNPNLVALSEHKISKDEIDRVNISNYRVCAHFARENTGGGGVMILAKNCVLVQEISSAKYLSLLEEKILEFFIVKFKTNEFSFILVCIYRSPKKCLEPIFFEKLEILLSYLTEHNSKLILVGDFNINVLRKDSSVLKTYFQLLI